MVGHYPDFAECKGSPHCQLHEVFHSADMGFEQVHSSCIHAGYSLHCSLAGRIDPPFDPPILGGSLTPPARTGPSFDRPSLGGSLTGSDSVAAHIAAAAD